MVPYVYPMPALGKQRWIVPAVALTLGLCLLILAFTCPANQAVAVGFLPLFFFGLVLVSMRRPVIAPVPAFVFEPFAPDIPFRGPPSL
jgi:hypothetical protein